MAEPSITAVVLAAGSATRFGGVKALAPLEGRALLRHVLDALAEAGQTNIVVVLGAAADAIEPAIAWRSERRVRNEHPERGLASSLQVGLEALSGASPVPDAALIVLGDQPRLRPAVVAQVIEAWRRGDRPIVVPRYAGSGALNPVLLDRSVWPLAMALEGDRGMGPLIKASPDLVLDVSVSGDNPDVDTPADLAGLTADR
jgi:molybdenum cofactor cytidylyltransferase